MTAYITTTPLICLLCARSPAVEVRAHEDGWTLSASIRTRLDCPPLLRGLRCPYCRGGLYRDEGEVTTERLRLPLPAEDARPRRGRPPQSKLIADVEPRPKALPPCRVCRRVPSRDASHRLCRPCEDARQRERVKGEAG